MAKKWKEISIILGVIIVGFLVKVFIVDYVPPANLHSNRVVFSAKTASMFLPQKISFYTVNVENEGSTRITSSFDDFYSPSWSAQGDRIAYFNGKGLFVADINNVEEAEVIWQGDEWGRVWWSPNSLIIVSSSYKGIHLFNSKTGKLLKQVDIDSSGWPPLSVTWSPDNSKMAVSNYEGLQIMDMGADEISTFTLPEQEFNTFDDPDWSPDGSKIVFTITSRVHGRHDFKHPGGIAVIDVDGTNLNRLTFQDRDSFPKWSPNGQQIAFVRLESKYVAEHNVYLSRGDIYVMNTDGTGLKKLTNGEEIDDPFVWVPNGNKIVFISDDISGCRSLNILPMDSLALFCPEEIKFVDIDSLNIKSIRRPTNESLSELVWVSPS